MRQDWLERWLLILARLGVLVVGIASLVLGFYVYADGKGWVPSLRGPLWQASALYLIAAAIAFGTMLLALWRKP